MAVFALSQVARAQESAATEKCVASPSGLIGWWRGEGDANDVLSKESATLDTASYATGKVGRAFSFANSETTLRFAGNEKRNNETQNGFTLEFWVNPRNAEPSEPLVEFRKDDQNVGVHLWIYDQAGMIWGNVMDTTGNHHVISTGPGLLLPNVWQHIALVYDRAGTGSIYLNGALVARKDIGSFAPQMSHDLFLGGHRPNDPDTRFYRGALDEVSLYSRPLAGSEISTIYRAGAAGKCVPGQTFATASTRASGTEPPAATLPSVAQTPVAAKNQPQKPAPKSSKTGAASTRKISSTNS